MTNNFLSSNQVILRIVTIISVVEFTIMDAFIFLNADISPFAEAALDIILLVIFATPLIYAWVMIPYIKSRDEAFADMEKLIHKDLLTELSNRYDIYCHLEKALSASVRHDFDGAVVLLDLGGLKDINDMFGHAAGDEVLIETANRLRSKLRVEDTPGRLDGDEFIIIINHVNSDQEKTRDYVMALADKLINSVSQPVQFEGKAINISVTIGIKLFNGEMDPDSAMHDANVALSRAKELGKDTAVIFDD